MIPTAALAGVMLCILRIAGCIELSWIWCTLPFWLIPLAEWCGHGFPKNGGLI